MASYDRNVGGMKVKKDDQDENEEKVGNGGAEEEGDGHESEDEDSEKTFLIDTFWQKVWPALKPLGWTQDMCTDNDDECDGSIYFIPPNEKVRYGRIEDVINRMLERRNNSESRLADVFLDAMKVANRPKNLLPVSPRVRKGAAKRQSSTKIDLSWKEGGRNFPQRSSKVGTQYQVKVIPSAGSYIEKENPKFDD